MAKYIVQMRRGTATQWEESDIIPLAGEIVVEIDDTNNLHKLKIGDGVHAYSALAYLMAGDEIVTQVLAKAMPRVVTVELTLDWVEAADATYSQVIAIDNITEHSRLDLQPNADMMAEFKQLGIALVTENDGGVITVYSVGNVPLKAYTMQATIVETDCSVEDPIVGIPVGAPSAGESGGSITLDQEVPWMNPDSASEANAPSTKAVADGLMSFAEFIYLCLCDESERNKNECYEAELVRRDTLHDALAPNVLRVTTVEGEGGTRATAGGLDVADYSLTSVKKIECAGGQVAVPKICSYGRNLVHHDVWGDNEPNEGWTREIPQEYYEGGGECTNPVCTADFIPCIGGETYSIVGYHTGGTTPSGRYHRYADFIFYDKDQTPCGLRHGEDKAWHFWTDSYVYPGYQSVTAPEGACWMKVVLDVSSVVGVTMLNRGTEPLPFEEYVYDELSLADITLTEGNSTQFYSRRAYRVWNGGTEVFVPTSCDVTITQDYYTKAPESATMDQVNEALGDISCLPEVTTDDNGKFLRVVDGAWSAVTIPSAEGESY